MPGTLAENEAQPTADKVKAVIERNHGEGIEIIALDKKRLAYPMNHIRYGYFFMVFFRAESADVQQIRADLRLMTELLRATVQKHDPQHSLRQIEFGQVYQPADPNAPFTESRPVVVEAPVTVVEKTVVEEVPATAVAPVLEAEPIVVVEEKPEILATPAPKKEKESKKKIDLDEIDKKLDEILDIDLGSV